MGLSANFVLAGITRAVSLPGFPIIVGLRRAQATTLRAWAPQPELEAREEAAVAPPPSGDPRAQIVTLYDALRPRLHSYLCSMRLSSDQAEEIIQEAFLRLTDQLLKDAVIQNLHGWVVRVAHNLARDLRKEHLQRWSGQPETEEQMLRELVDASPTPEEAYLHREKHRRLSEALTALEERDRQCFELRMQGLSYQDIGRVLGISTPRADQLVRRVAVRLAVTCD